MLLPVAPGLGHRIQKPVRTGTETIKIIKKTLKLIM